LPVASGTTTAATTTAPAEKYIVNANGNYLTGWAAGAATSGAPSVLKIIDSIAGQATSTSNLRFNLDDRATAIPTPATPTPFDPANTSMYNWSSSQEVFSGVADDTTAHSLKMYFAKSDAAPNTWNVYSSLDGVMAPTPQTLTFGQSGVISSGGTFSTTGSVTANVRTSDPLTGAVINTPTVVPLTIALDLGATTQFASGFDQAKAEQNGYKNGYLVSTNMGADGALQGTFSNGKTQTVATVALATFINPNGLQSIGDNLWLQSQASGLANVGTAGTGGRGVLGSNSLEQSNVDLSSELVNMITMQRNYQANAQSIKTQDEVLKTLSGLR
jgi:flagellar hook protein FlgE